MIKIRELEVWTRPGAKFEQEYGKEILEKKMTQELFLPDGVVIGLSNISDEIDVFNLKAAFDEGELVHSDFSIFCRENMLAVDDTDIESANRFLSYSYGYPVTWLHLPDNEKGKQYLKEIIIWTSMNDLCVVDPEDLFCLV